MPPITAGDIELHHELTGRGDPLVLVHGSWSDHHNWDTVVPLLAPSFSVVAYDRRGHGRSARTGDGARRTHEDDLVALLERLDLGPAHVVGSSFGGGIAIGVAGRRPDLVRSVVAHEPPLVSIVADDPEAAPLLDAVDSSLQAVMARLEAGEDEAGARQFVEELALGPGGWDLLPPPLRETMIATASGFAAEQRDPDWAAVDRDVFGSVVAPVLLTQGDQSPAWFAPIVRALAWIVPGAEVHTYRGAGHAPHLTHPDAHAACVAGFLARTARA